MLLPLPVSQPRPPAWELYEPHSVSPAIPPRKSPGPFSSSPWVGEGNSPLLEDWIMFKSSILFPYSNTSPFRMWLQPNKPIIRWKYHTSEMHLIHLTYQTSQLSIQHMAEVQLFPLMSTQLTRSCCSAQQGEQRWYHISLAQEEIQIAKFEVWFLLNAYHFHTTRVKNKKS
jgi:hypothetical protein